jgi:hypothetical protein
MLSQDYLNQKDTIKLIPFLKEHKFDKASQDVTESDLKTKLTSVPDNQIRQVVKALNQYREKFNSKKQYSLLKQKVIEPIVEVKEKDKRAFNEIEVLNNAHNAAVLTVTAAKKKALGNTVIKIIQKEWQKEMERLDYKKNGPYSKTSVNLGDKSLVQSGHAEIESNKVLYIYGNALEVLARAEFYEVVEELHLTNVRFDLIVYHPNLDKLRRFRKLKKLVLSHNALNSFILLSKIECISSLSNIYITDNEILSCATLKSFVVYRFQHVTEVSSFINPLLTIHFSSVQRPHRLRQRQDNRQAGVPALRQDPQRAERPDQEASCSLVSRRQSASRVPQAEQEARRLLLWMVYSTDRECREPDAC